MELLGEEIDTKVTVLAGLSGRGDADDLARTALKDKKIADADVVAWYGDGVRSSATLNQADALANTLTNAGRAGLVSVNDYFLTLMVVMGMERMKYAVGSFFEAMADGVVVTVVVVVTHFGFGWVVNGCFGVNFGEFSTCLRTSGSPAFSFNNNLSAWFG